VYMNLGGGLAELADQLDAIVSMVDVADNLNAMASIMEAVAIRVFWGAPIASAPGADQKVDASTKSIRTELSVECAMHFAQMHGYPVSSAHISHDQITRVMLSDTKWGPLGVIFETALVTASLADDSPVMADDHCYPNLIVDTRRSTPANPHLSAESHANLRSVAFQRRWTDADILMLITEHFRLKLDEPSIVYYGDTVSGEDWANLYNWINRRNRRSLWEPTARSSPRSFRLLSIRSRRPQSISKQWHAI
jgi:hypothetical protein